MLSELLKATKSREIPTPTQLEKLEQLSHFEKLGIERMGKPRKSIEDAPLPPL
jgi:hypothetical protein